MAQDSIAKGDALLAEAEAQLRPGGCCASGRRSGAEEAACDAYARAANAFKIAKEWRRAGDALAEAAALMQGGGRQTEAGQRFADAAKCYRKVCPEECARCLREAAAAYEDVGRAATAAKLRHSLAELHEQKGDLREAADEFRRAADAFTSLEMASSRTKCLVSFATHSAVLGDHRRAGETFEELAEAAVSNKLLKYTANEHLVHAGLCQLAEGDGPGLLRKLEDWKSANPAFEGSRECHFLATVASAVEVDELNEAVRSHQTRLSDWENGLVQKIRRRIGPDLR